MQRPEDPVRLRLFGMTRAGDKTGGGDEEKRAGEEQLVNLVGVSHENQRCDDKRTASCSLMMEGTGGGGEAFP